MSDFSAHRVPVGTIVLHVGPHKTGTTTLQAALGQHRGDLRELGVIYPGSVDHEMNASMAAGLAKVNPGQSFERHLARWHKLIAQFDWDAASSRVQRGVLSSEFYCEATPERIAWIVDELRAPVQVVITLRPLAKILPSQWQQYVQNQHVISYEDWLKGVLAKPESGPPTPTFWRRHHHAALARKWAGVVGADRVTVVAVDDRDRGFILRAFEGLLGVPERTLDVENTTRNRSLSYAEIELLRAFNRSAKAAKISAADYTRFIRFGAARVLQNATFAAEQQPVLTPGWAVERANDLQAEFIADIRSLGVDVIGDLDQLADRNLGPAVGENEPVTSIDARIAATLAAGLAQCLSTVSPADNGATAGPAGRAVSQRHRLAALSDPSAEPALPSRTRLALEVGRRVARRTGISRR